jgi:hypothetical protein
MSMAAVPGYRLSAISSQLSVLSSQFSEKEVLLMALAGCSLAGY